MCANQRDDPFPERRELTQLVFNRPYQEPPDSRLPVGDDFLRALLGRTHQEELMQFYLRASQHRAQDVTDDPLRRGAILGNVEKHRRDGAGKSIRVLACGAEVLSKPSPGVRERLRRSVVGGGKPAVAQTGRTA